MPRGRKPKETIAAGDHRLLTIKDEQAWTDAIRHAAAISKPLGEYVELALRFLNDLQDQKER